VPPVAGATPPEPPFVEAPLLVEPPFVEAPLLVEPPLVLVEPPEPVPPVVVALASDALWALVEPSSHAAAAKQMTAAPAIECRVEVRVPTRYLMIRMILADTSQRDRFVRRDRDDRIENLHSSFTSMI
jgi:hypothetical protein